MFTVYTILFSSSLFYSNEHSFFCDAFKTDTTIIISIDMMSTIMLSKY